MAQILPPAKNLGDVVSKGLREGFQETFLPALQQQYQKSRLQNAFNQIQPGGDFLSQLKTIAPELLTTPGGAQALSELVGPLVSAAAQNQAIQDAINRRGGNAPPGGTNNVSSISGQVPAQNPSKGTQGTTDFRNPTPPVSPITPFPQRTAGPIPQPEMSPQEIENLAFDIMKSSAAVGTPKGYEEAYNIALSRNNTIRDSNLKIGQEQKLQQEAQNILSQGMINRGRNAGLTKRPEDETVLGKFANEALNAPDPETGWEYVRTKMRDFNTARDNLLRNYDRPGPITAGIRKILGEYKDLETAGKEAQPFLDFYRQHGLYDEARNDLTSHIGLGPEQAESWLFPLSKEQKQMINNFPENKTYTKQFPKNKEKTFEQMFPGEKYNLDPEKFQEFKENLFLFLKNNPGVNLISSRGPLNQDKGYSWNDISRAINELQEEKRFTPDAVQREQMAIINNAPLPGIASQLKFIWGGKK